METITDILKEAARGMYIDENNYLRLDPYYHCEHNRVADLYFLRDYGVVTLGYYHDFVFSARVNPGFEKLFERESED